MLDRDNKYQRLIEKYYAKKKIVPKGDLFKNEIINNISLDSKVLDAGCGFNAEIILEYVDLLVRSSALIWLKSLM